MSGRVTQENGAFCPIQDRDAMIRRLTRKGTIWRLADLGLEKRCSRCQEYWPADTEFWFSEPQSAGGLSSWCKACFREWRSGWRAAS